MKRIILALLLLPKIALAQYFGDTFNLDNKTVPVEQKNVELNIQKDTIINIDIRGSIYGLSVTGTALLENNSDSYVRVILRDDHNYEYLVYECFPLLTDTLTPQFQNIALETKTLDGINPQNIRVELKNASISIDSFDYIPESEAAKGAVVNTAILQKEQARHMADMMNENLVRRNMTWRAGVTSMSEKSFEEKKSMFGGKTPQLYGFDYYIGGIFVMPGSEIASQQTVANNDRSLSYVSEWDWRNRHGKNWMTSVKDQDTCNTCWAFAAIGLVEAYTNLYYNNTIHLNLAEQELPSCIIGKNNQTGGDIGSDGLNYIVNNGVVNESCIPYETLYTPNCNTKCQNPEEKVYLGGYGSVAEDEDSVKRMLFKSPLGVSFINWSHAVIMVGYKKVEVGSRFYIPDLNTWLTIPSGSPFVGKTAWLVKNSRGNSWGTNGYGYVIAEMAEFSHIYYPSGSIIRIGHTDADIQCTDADGDGYYVWGSGNRPSHCPSWAYALQDGDDSDINYGPINSYGVLAELPEGRTINSECYYAYNTTETSRIGIVNGGILHVSSNVTLAGDANIRICEGGTLIVDSGSILNAKITLIPGSTLIVRDGGTISMASGYQFEAPIGVTVIVEDGKIQ